MLRYISKLIQSITLWADFIIYILFSPFKFKKFPIKVQKILVVEERLIGDLIVIIPVLRALKFKYKADIHLLINPKMADIAVNLPYVDEIKTSKRSIEKDYDLGIILHKGSFSTSFVLLRNNVKYRVGCTKEGVFTAKGFFLNKKTFPNTKEQHKIEDNLDVIRSIGIDTQNKSLQLKTNEKSEQKILKLFKDKKIKGLKVVIHPGANFKSHEWINERYIPVIDYLYKKYAASIILTGSEKDKKITQSIVTNSNVPILDLSGSTTISEFFSVINNADLVISVDTSAMHVAAAFNKPTIAIFGNGHPKIWYPFTKKRVVLFKNYSTKNIMSIDVIKAVENILQK